MVYPARSVSADPLVFAVGALHVTSTLFALVAGVDPVDVELDDEAVDVVLLEVVPRDIESAATVPIGPAALGTAFEALVLLVSLHPASRPEASKEQTTHDPRAPITRPS